MIHRLYLFFRKAQKPALQCLYEYLHIRTTNGRPYVLRDDFMGGHRDPPLQRASAHKIKPAPQKWDRLTCGTTQIDGYENHRSVHLIFFNAEIRRAFTQRLEGSCKTVVWKPLTLRFLSLTSLVFYSSCHSQKLYLLNYTDVLFSCQ